MTEPAGEESSQTETSLYDDLTAIGFKPYPSGTIRALRPAEDDKPLLIELPISLEEGIDAITPEADFIFDPYCRDLNSEIHELLARARKGICVCLSSKRAYRGNTASAFLARLKHRLPALSDIEENLHLALHEAITNAIIHGNLELDSKGRSNLVYFRDYIRKLTEQIEHPVSSRKAVILCARWSDGQLIIGVEDCGAGFDPHVSLSRPVAPTATSGRGIWLIKQLSHDVAFSQGGRRIEMTFLLPG
jgi:anti-sigma regulatory factor (Ser/Thr protein kinase)